MYWRDKVKLFDCKTQDISWINRLNHAVDYIEDHLHSDLDYDKLAKTACCSTHHFQRMFSFIIGISVSEYVRRRRLTAAGFDLLNTKQKIIDVSAQYGYDSPTAFSRAFKKMHGIAPSAVRSSTACLCAYPKVQFQISVKGDIKMDYRIVHRKAFEVFGVETVIRNQDNQAVMQFWQESRSNGSIAKIKQAAQVAPETPVHAVLYNCNEERYKYLLCLPVCGEICTEGFTRLVIPEGSCAVFTTPALSYEEMSSQAAALWKVVFTEWFGISGYELAPAPEMELHYITQSGKYIAEIWIPILNHQQ